MSQVLNARAKRSPRADMSPTEGAVEEASRHGNHDIKFIDLIVLIFSFHN